MTLKIKNLDAKISQREPKGANREAKGSPKAAKGGPKGRPEGAQGDAKRVKNRSCIWKAFLEAKKGRCARVLVPIFASFLSILGANIDDLSCYVLASFFWRHVW